MKAARCHRLPSRRHILAESGFTLIEVLIAATILALLLASTGGLLVTSLRAYQTTEEVTQRTQDVEAAVRVISYDLQLAGLRGLSASELDDSGRDFGGNPTLAIVKGATAETPDRLTIRYYESDDRLYGADDPCADYCEVTFRIGQADDGTSVLFRIQDDGSSEEETGIIRDMNNLKVLGFLTRAGATVNADLGAEAPVASMTAINLELTLANGEVWRFPVAVPNRQSVSITGGN